MTSREGNSRRSAGRRDPTISRTASARLASAVAVCVALVSALAWLVSVDFEGAIVLEEMGFRLVLWIVAGLGLLGFLVAGDRLRGRFGDDRKTVRILQGALALTIVVLDMPGGHSIDCGMSAGAWSLAATGAWWMPNALYTLASLLVLARYLEPFVERVWLLPLWGGVTIALGYALEVATHARAGYPWWAIHALVQLLLVTPVAFTFQRGFRPKALVLPLFAAFLPFGPWSFWHACTRLRTGDPLAVAVEKLDGYWLIPHPWTASDVRSPVRTVDVRALEGSQGLTFAAIDGSDACTCDVRLEGDRVVSFTMSSD